jgi:integrase
LARLFLLPRALAKDVDSRAVEGREAALIMQQAVATSILTYCPMRMETLASLRLDINLRWTGPGMRGELIVDVEPGIVKNRLALSFPLPDDCASLVRGYIQTWRDKLLFPSSPYLFPSRDPLRHKQTSGFAVQLSRLIFERLGFRITPHDYRHLVHLVVLKRFPGAYAMVSRILGHKRLESTLRNYAHEDTAIALQLYHELIGDELAHRDIGTSGDPAVRAYALNEGRR